jgi:hypothetical protein
MGRMVHTSQANTSLREDKFYSPTISNNISNTKVLFTELEAFDTCISKSVLRKNQMAYLGG